jgi:hypothetical protein
VREIHSSLFEWGGVFATFKEDSFKVGRYKLYTKQPATGVVDHGKK